MAIRNPATGKRMTKKQAMAFGRRARGHAILGGGTSRAAAKAGAKSGDRGGGRGLVGKPNYKPRKVVGGMKKAMSKKERMKAYEKARRPGAKRKIRLI